MRISVARSLEQTYNHEGSGTEIVGTADGFQSSAVGMNHFVQDAFYAVMLVVVGPFFLRGFGLGPGSDVSRSSPSGGENLCFGVGTP